MWIYHTAPSDTLQTLALGPFAQCKNLLKDIIEPHKIYHGEIGEPKIGAPEIFHQKMQQIISHNDWSSYPKVQGDQYFLQSIIHWLYKRYTMPYRMIEERHILPLTGSREGLFQLGTYAIKKKQAQLNGEKPLVLCANPFYHVYKACAFINNADLITYDLKNLYDTQQFASDVIAKLSPKMLNRLAVMYLNNPDNPTGITYYPEDLEQLYALAIRYNFIIIADECYSEIYYSQPPIGMAEIADKAKNLHHVFIVNSLSKRSSVPGMRSGFAVIDDAHMPGVLSLRGHISAIHPGALLDIASALWRDEIHVQANRNHYKNLLDISANKIGYFDGYSPPDGGFFLWMNVGNGEKFAYNIYKYSSIKVLPGRYMSLIDPETNQSPGDAYVRVAMVEKEQEFREMIDIMALYLHKNYS